MNNAMQFRATKVVVSLVLLNLSHSHRSDPYFLPGYNCGILNPIKIIREPTAEDISKGCVLVNRWSNSFPSYNWRIVRHIGLYNFGQRAENVLIDRGNVCVASDSYCSDYLGPFRKTKVGFIVDMRKTKILSAVSLRNSLLQGGLYRATRDFKIELSATSEDGPWSFATNGTLKYKPKYSKKIEFSFPTPILARYIKFTCINYTGNGCGLHYFGPN